MAEREPQGNLLRFRSRMFGMVLNFPEGGSPEYPLASVPLNVPTTEEADSLWLNLIREMIEKGLLTSEQVVSGVKGATPGAVAQELGILIPPRRDGPAA